MRWCNVQANEHDQQAKTYPTYCYEFWQELQQQCCWGPCQMSERLGNSKHKSRSFETLRDLTIGRFIGKSNCPNCAVDVLHLFLCCHVVLSKIIMTIWITKLVLIPWIYAIIVSSVCLSVCPLSFNNSWTHWRIITKRYPDVSFVRTEDYCFSRS